jgi:hypothetical protein
MKLICVGLLFTLSIAPCVGQISAKRPGPVFAVTKDYDAVFEGSVTYLKKKGLQIKTNKDAGQIDSDMVVRNGKIDEVGERVFLSLVRDSATSTSVNVIVLEYKRRRWTSRPEPWSKGKFNADESDNTAKELKTALEATEPAS